MSLRHGTKTQLDGKKKLSKNLAIQQKKFASKDDVNVKEDCMSSIKGVWTTISDLHH